MRAPRFPFHNHLHLNEADALQVLRERMTDAEVLALFDKRAQTVQERIAAFLERNPRPKASAA